MFQTTNQITMENHPAITVMGKRTNFRLGHGFSSYGTTYQRVQWLVNRDSPTGALYSPMYWLVNGHDSGSDSLEIPTICKAYVLGLRRYTKYGLKYGTNVPRFQDPEPVEVVESPNQSSTNQAFEHCSWGHILGWVKMFNTFLGPQILVMRFLVSTIFSNFQYQPSFLGGT